jgi:hypothetical protein
MWKRLDAFAYKFYAMLWIRIRIGIGLQGLPIQSRIWIWIHFNQMKRNTRLFSRKFQYTVQNTENDNTYDTDEKDKTVS